MKICVLNGSPRGQYSTTLQTGLYLQKRYPRHEFAFVEVGSRINSLEKGLAPALTAMQSADLIVFSYPVYTFLAPSQLHRFIAALKAGGAGLRGKCATQITTSKHFYDVTAHRYIEDNCRDLGLRVIRGLSADMEDLLTEKGRRDAEQFLEYAVWCAENGVCEPAPAPQSATAAASAPAPAPVGKTDGHDVAIVADLREGDERLRAMIDSLHRRSARRKRAWSTSPTTPSRAAASAAFTARATANASTPTASTPFCATPSRRRTPSSTPSPCATTPWARRSRPTTTGSSATATAPSPRARPWATS